MTSCFSSTSVIPWSINDCTMSLFVLVSGLSLSLMRELEKLMQDQLCRPVEKPGAVTYEIIAPQPALSPSLGRRLLKGQVNKTLSAQE